MQKSRETVSGGTANEDRETCHTACCCKLKCNEIMNYHGILSEGEQSGSTGGPLKQATATREQKRPATVNLAPRVSCDQ